MTGPSPAMNDEHTAERRPESIERTVGVDAPSPTETARRDVPHDVEADLDRRLQDLETSIDGLEAQVASLTALEGQVASLEAMVQSLRARLDGVDAVNREVERRADAALSAVDSLQSSANDAVVVERIDEPSGSVEAPRTDAAVADATGTADDTATVSPDDHVTTAVADDRVATDSVSDRMPTQRGDPGRDDVDRRRGVRDAESVSSDDAGRLLDGPAERLREVLPCTGW